MKANSADLLAVIELLAETFPKCFAVLETRRRPLKLGIHHDIVAAQPSLDTKLLRRALHRYTYCTAYWISLGRYQYRYDLNGDIAGEVSEEHRAGALAGIAALKRRRENQKRDREMKAAKEERERVGHPSNANKPKLSLKIKKGG